MTKAKRSAEIDAYLAQAAPASRELLRALRKTIHDVVPDAEECISYGLPAFRWRGRVVAGFSATTKGCSYYPFSGSTFLTLGDALARFDKTKSALHFSPEKPLPATLVRKLLRARLAEIES